MQASTGAHVVGVSLPHPDVNDPFTMLDGVVKRIGAKLPEPNPVRLQEFKDFVKLFVKARLGPLSPDADLGFDSWIESKGYPDWRKEELRAVYDQIPFDPEVTDYAKNIRSLPKKYLKVKSFMKRETYTEKKHGRGIFARSDYMKVLFGPLCAAIEHEVYNNPEFIKHVPVAERAAFLAEFFTNDATKFIATDYSSFESSFRKELMEACENILFEHMTQFLKGKLESRMKYYTNGTNVCEFRWFTTILEACRMSGEMDTSLSNGFTNICVFYFLAYKKGHITLKDLSLPPEKVRAIVEGDDLIGYMNGDETTLEDYEQLGFNCKIEIHKAVTTASFCGMIFDPEELTNIVDPLKVLANFGWVDGKYSAVKRSRMQDLLRCKALSLVYQYPGCPIIQELGRYGMRATSTRTNNQLRQFLQTDRRMDMYTRQLYTEVLDKVPSPKPVGMKTRLLMEEKFGVTVEQQLQTEAYLRSKTDYHSPLVLPWLIWPRAWEQNDLDYCHIQRLKEDGSYEIPLYYVPGPGALDHGFATISFKRR